MSPTASRLVNGNKYIVFNFEGVKTRFGKG